MSEGNKAVTGATKQQTLLSALSRQDEPTKNTRTSLTWLQKQSLLYDVEHAGISRDALAQKWGIGARTLRRLLTRKSRKEIQANAKKIGDRKRNRPKSKPTLEDHLVDWIEKARSCKINLSVSRLALRVAAKKIRLKLLHPDSGISSEERLELQHWKEPGKLWVQRFARRYHLSSVILHGAAGDVDKSDPAIKDKIDEIKALTEDYDLDNIYNVDEFGLFFKCLPRRTFLAKSENKKTARGSKKMKAKDRMTGYACTNATGTQKVPTATIGKPKQPRCFTARGVGQATNTSKWRGLPLPYFNQKRAWSDSYVMTKWFQDVFLPHVRLAHRNAPVLLIMDNCGCHTPRELKQRFHDPTGQVRLATLPPNTTSVFQPMDAGVIAWLKAQYKLSLLSKLVGTVDQWEELHEQAISKKAGLTGLEDGHLPNILDALELLRDVHDRLKPRTIAKCWLKCDILANRHAITLKTWIKSPHSEVSNSGISDVFSAEISDICQQLSSLEVSSTSDITDIDDNVISALAHAQDVVGANPDTAIECWINMEDDTEAQAEQLLELIDEDGSAGGANTNDNSHHDGNESSAIAKECTGPDARVRPLMDACDRAKYQASRLRHVLGSIDTQLTRETTSCMLKAAIMPVVQMLHLLPAEGLNPDFVRIVHKANNMLRESKALKQPKRKQTSMFGFLKKQRRVVDILQEEAESNVQSSNDNADNE